MSTLAVPEDWDDKSVEMAAEIARKRIEGQIRYFYCTRGRTCDGFPHEGYNYSHARSDQWPPPGQDWLVWAILSGRGSGKTRTGSEWTRKLSERVSAIGLVGRRGVDVRETMVEGVGEDPVNGAGLIHACERAGVSYLWEPSKKLFTFGNGCKALGFSAEEPDSLRGKNLGAAWIDEPAHMPLIEDVWAMLKLTLRQKRSDGGRAQILVTTTPKPIKWVKEIVAEPDSRVVRVSTRANLHNLDQAFAQAILKSFDGTRLGRQEIDGEILEDVEGALWNSELIVHAPAPVTGYDRVIVAVDPAGTSNRRSDETGIVVVGKHADLFYVIADYSGRYSPSAWAKKVEYAYDHHQADRVIVERNYGQEMLGSVFKAAGVDLPVTEVNSRRGKAIRAEPVVALYEQARVVHAEGQDLGGLESQMLEWVPGEDDSPDRVDALVHGILLLSGRHTAAEIALPGNRRLTDAPRVSLGLRRPALRSRS